MDTAKTMENNDDTGMPGINLDSTVGTQIPTTQMLTTPASQPDCALLSLPAELRNRIYELALITPTPITCWTRKFLAGERPKHAETGLIRTCQQIRNEGLKIYYHDNIFELRCCVKLDPSPELPSLAHFMRVIRVFVHNQCSHGHLYFELNLRDGAERGKLVLVRPSRGVWENGKGVDCSKAPVLDRAQAYLKGFRNEEGKTDGLTAETLRHLLKILTEYIE